MRKLLFALCAALSGATFAAVDYPCVDNCTKRGNQHAYCLQACSYEQTPPGAGALILQQQKKQEPRVDAVCMDECSAKGHQRGYCVKTCSY